MFPNFSQRELHKIYVHACGRTVIFNANDGKQAKMFSLVYKIQIFKYFDNSNNKEMEIN